MDERPEVVGWVALFDEVDRLIHDDASYAEGSSIVGQAIERLYAYEHQMTPATRQLAHEHLWMRDFPDVSLPSERRSWALCQCRWCAIARRLAQARRQPTAYEAQRAVLTRQRRSSS